MIFLLLRRMNPRTRMITGAVLVVAGSAAVAVSAAVAGLAAHGIALVVIGAAMCVSAIADKRRARRDAYRPTANSELINEGNAHV